MEVEEQLARIVEIVDKARIIAPAAVVFGSSVQPGRVPNDVDLMLYAHPESREASKLLSLARMNYGWLDVFVRPPSGRLLVRNDLATGWTYARRAREIAAAAAREGISLSDFEPRFGLPSLGPSR